MRVLKTDGSGETITKTLVDFRIKYVSENGAEPTPIAIAEEFYRRGIVDSKEACDELDGFPHVARDLITDLEVRLHDMEELRVRLVPMLKAFLEFD